MSVSAEKGFTLIESLVALAILGIAAVGIIRAAEGHVDAMRGLERRAAAQIVAQNALAEAALGIPVTREESMLGARWLIGVRTMPSADPDISQVVVEVRSEGEDQPIVTMRGFLDKGTTSP